MLCLSPTLLTPLPLVTVDYIQTHPYLCSKVLFKWQDLHKDFLVPPNPRGTLSLKIIMFFFITTFWPVFWLTLFNSYVRHYRHSTKCFHDITLFDLYHSPVIWTAFGYWNVTVDRESVILLEVTELGDCRIGIQLRSVWFESLYSFHRIMLIKQQILFIIILYLSLSYVRFRATPGSSLWLISLWIPCIFLHMGETKQKLLKLVEVNSEYLKFGCNKVQNELWSLTHACNPYL